MTFCERDIATAWKLRFPLLLTKSPNTESTCTPTTHVFLNGATVMMVQVQSTWFPLYDRNPQKFVENIYKARDADYEKGDTEGVSLERSSVEHTTTGGWKIESICSHLCQRSGGPECSWTGVMQMCKLSSPSPKIHVCVTDCRAVYHVRPHFRLLNGALVLASHHSSYAPIPLKLLAPN